jgi:hypothetical protein
MRGCVKVALVLSHVIVGLLVAAVPAGAEPLPPAVEDVLRYVDEGHDGPPVCCP